MRGEERQHPGEPQEQIRDNAEVVVLRRVHNLRPQHPSVPSQPPVHDDVPDVAVDRREQADVNDDHLELRVLAVEVVRDDHHDRSHVLASVYQMRERVSSHVVLVDSLPEADVERQVPSQNRPYHLRMAVRQVVAFVVRVEKAADHCHVDERLRHARQDVPDEETEERYF